VDVLQPFTFGMLCYVLELKSTSAFAIMNMVLHMTNNIKLYAKPVCPKRTQ